MAENETQENQTEGKGGRKKGLMVIGGVVIFEAVLIIGAMMLVGGPEPVKASDVLPDAQPESDKIVEILVIDERLPNNRQGINYVYDTEVWVHTRNRYEAMVSDELNRFRNEIKAELMAIWRTAEPRHLQEPRMENLTRKVYALLSQRFGDDTESEEPVISKCVIVSGPGFRVDG